jgi:SAM-dependent methyltransferase
MRFDQLEESAAYDGVWASASLLHAPAAELTSDLARIHRALKPGGLFVASFKAGNGEGRDMFGRYYNYPMRRH